MTTSRVPTSLEEVSVRGEEVEPAAVGAEAAGVEGIWQAVERLYRSGIHPAIQVCVRRHGQIVLDRAIGYARGNGPNDPPEAKKVPVALDTPFTIFSASKAVTAMVVHLLDQKNLIRLDDPVCEYIPEFGVRRKQWITIRHVLAHRAGIPSLPPDVMQLDRLRDWDGIVQRLCEAEPTWRAGRQLAYHAMTGGFLLGEVVRRVTGDDIRTVLDREIRRPLRLRWLGYGVHGRELAKVAHNYFTGPPPLPPLSTVLQRALGVGFRQAAEMSNDRRFLEGIVPSGNVVTTARELSRFYEMLLNGGEVDGVRIFDRRTIRRAISEQSYLEFDLTIGLPLRYGMGFMLGGKWLGPYGPDTQYAFGHLGFTNIVSWADPERGLAAAILTSGKPLLYPQLYYALDVLWQIGRVFTKETGQPLRGAVRRRAQARSRGGRRRRPGAAAAARSRRQR